MDWGWGYGFGMIKELYTQAHILLCGLVPNRLGPIPVHGREVGDPWFMLL